MRLQPQYNLFFFFLGSATAVGGGERLAEWRYPHINEVEKSYNHATIPYSQLTPRHCFSRWILCIKSAAFFVVGGLPFRCVPSSLTASSITIHVWLVRSLKAQLYVFVVFLFLLKYQYLGKEQATDITSHEKGCVLYCFVLFFSHFALSFPTKGSWLAKGFPQASFDISILPCEPLSSNSFSLRMATLLWSAPN